MNQIGLFEGLGGFSLAARWVGWETIAWCEWNPFCQQVLNYHFPKAQQHGDIKTTDFSIYRGQCDILTGGFPCQPYSTAGKRKGTDDDRHLWPQMLRAVREIQPGYVVGENVRGLTNWNGGLVFDQVQADLEAEGYEVLPFLLPACTVNAPHRRDRIWFVAYSGSQQLQDRAQKRNTENTTEERTGLDNRVKRPGNNGLITNANGIGLRRQDNRVGESRFVGKTCANYNWQDFPTQSPLCSRNDGLSSRLAGITFSKHRNESLKAYGNAIVPQVAYEIFKAIESYASGYAMAGRTGY